jgi:hypothetical protein
LVLASLIQQLVGDLRDCFLQILQELLQMEDQQLQVLLQQPQLLLGPNHELVLEVKSK